MLWLTAEEQAESLTDPAAWWMAVTCIIHVHGLPVQAIIHPKEETPAEQAIRLRVRREALLTARRHIITVCRQEASLITARLAEVIRLREANLIARLRGLTVSRRTALLQEVTARHPAVEAVAAVVRAVLQEVQDNLRLS
jgi:hypothetical protein